MIVRPTRQRTQIKIDVMLPNVQYSGKILNDNASLLLHPCQFNWCLKILILFQNK